jgi:hypothetical protein
MVAWLFWFALSRRLRLRYAGSNGGAAVGGAGFSPLAANGIEHDGAIRCLPALLRYLILVGGVASGLDQAGMTAQPAGSNWDVFLHLIFSRVAITRPDRLFMH